MKMIKTAVLLGVLGMLAMPAPSDSAQTLLYGIVDVNKVMNEANVSKDLFNTLDAKRKEYLVFLKKQSDELNKKGADIRAQKDKMTPEQRKAKEDDYVKNATESQRKAKELETALMSARDSSKEKLRQEIAKTVAKIADEKGYATVFTQDAVIISASGLDITAEVIARMNKDVKKIPVDWSGGKK